MTSDFLEHFSALQTNQNHFQKKDCFIFKLKDKFNSSVSQTEHKIAVAGLYSVFVIVPFLCWLSHSQS